MAHDPDLVSRIKGALRAGLEPKLISRLTGISPNTIQEWAEQDTRANVEAADIRSELARAILGRFMGRGSAR